MRALTLTLAIAFPFGLAACNAEPEQPEVIEDMQEDVEGPIEEEVQQELGVQTDVYGGYDADGDMMLSEAEYDAGIGDGAFATYDTDGDGFLNEEEYAVYEQSMEM